MKKENKIPKNYTGSEETFKEWERQNESREKAEEKAKWEQLKEEGKLPISNWCEDAMEEAYKALKEGREDTLREDYDEMGEYLKKLESKEENPIDWERTIMRALKNGEGDKFGF